MLLEQTGSESRPSESTLLQESHTAHTHQELEQSWARELLLHRWWSSSLLEKVPPVRNHHSQIFFSPAASGGPESRGARTS